jgi:FMN-dependent NADH-azoreductase
MKTLLVLDCSGRVTRSITRRLTHRFAAAWQARNSDGRVIHRDLGQDPPPPVNEPWIAAAFADPSTHTPAMREALGVSEVLIEEIASADVIAIGTPIYNFGPPAQLKAYFDQVIRIGRTFAFSPGSAEPYQPLLRPRPVIVITSAGDGAMLPGGALAHLNFLDPHLATMLGFIGLTDVSFVRAGYDEFQDDRLRRSIADAERKLDELAEGLCMPELVARSA